MLKNCHQFLLRIIPISSVYWRTSARSSWMLGKWLSGFLYRCPTSVYIPSRCNNSIKNATASSIPFRTSLPMNFQRSLKHNCMTTTASTKDRLLSLLAIHFSSLRNHTKIQTGHHGFHRLLMALIITHYAKRMFPFLCQSQSILWSSPTQITTINMILY